MKIPNHPNPIDQSIAFILVYENVTISFNSFGQRLGSYYEEEGREQSLYCTFYTSDRVIITLKNNRTLVLFPDMSEECILEEANTELYWENPLYKNAEYDAGHIIYYHFRDFIPRYMRLIDGVQELLHDAHLSQKYHYEVFLELYAIFKILGLTSCRRSLMEGLFDRIKTEMKLDLYLFPERSEFPTINDVFWNELNQLPIFQSLKKITDL